MVVCLKNHTYSPPMSQKENRSSLRILYGVIVGTIIGALLTTFAPEPTVEWIVKNVTSPIGTGFLRALFMIVVPLVFSSLAAGVADLGTVSHLGKLGTKLAVYYLVTTFMAVIVGQAVVSITQPGRGVNPDYIESAQTSLALQTEGLRERSEAVGESLWPGIVNTIIPRNILEELGANNMLAVIFVSLFFGIGLLSLERKKAEVPIQFFQAISEVTIKMVGWIMIIAPYAVACLMVNAIAQFDLSILANVAKYFGVVVLCYILHFTVNYSIVLRVFVKISPFEFFRRMVPVFLTAFSTSSSNATLPTTIRNLNKRFGVPERIATFSAPLGATINMDGTALFEVVAALFIAQVFGIDLSLGAQVSLVLIVIITSVGVAGVPGGSIPILMSAMATVGIPPEGIALVLGIDRLLDMGRTVINVTGDSIAALYLARIEGIPLDENIKELD